MPILNYTTTISVERSVAEISTILAAHGATSILIDYGEDRLPAALAFRISTQFGDRRFALPANVSGVEAVLTRQRVRARSVAARAESHAARVAWRIVKDWVEAQMAFVESGQAAFEQVMLPYMLGKGERTVYQVMRDQHLALEAPRRNGKVDE
jgi:hypothetical protein